MTKHPLAIASFVLAALVTVACVRPATPAPTPVPTSLYVPLLDSPIRGLSQEEIGELEAGAGAGFARVAELNGYPGPRHVLDLYAQLSLSEEQRMQVQALYDGMNAEARALGAEILQGEAELELAFRSQTVDEATLETLVSGLAEKYGGIACSASARSLGDHPVVDSTPASPVPAVAGLLRTSFAGSLY